MCTPAGYGAPDARWDTWRICEFAEILGFYGLQYWYTWQVSVLGLGPIWMSRNEAVKQRAAQRLEEGGIFAFGLSEKAHGADIYSTDMILTPRDEGVYTASGRKDYIGNGNAAAIVSTFGKIAGSDDYVFFAADWIEFGGHRGFVELALDTGALVVPMTIHGAHQSTFVLTRGRRIAEVTSLRRAHIQVFPFIWNVPSGVTPGFVPSIQLPSKISVRLGPALDWSRFGKNAARDPDVVTACYDEITAVMQETPRRAGGRAPLSGADASRRAAAEPGAAALAARTSRLRDMTTIARG